MENQPRVVVRRSERRVRTVSARREGDAIVVLVPAHLSQREEDEWVARMVAKVQARDTRRRRVASDDELMARAEQLCRELLDPQLERPAPRPLSVRWVGNQNRRWGSCTPQEASIRLSARLQAFPRWVQDHVLLHELVHLLEPAHNAHFHRLLGANPRAERAEGFLHGYALAKGDPDAGEPWADEPDSPLD